MSKRTKIAFIITGLSTGGAEMMLLKLLQHIDRARFEPFVVSLTTKDTIGGYLESLDIPVIALGMRPSRPNLTKFFWLIKFLRKLKPEVVHTWMYHADFFGGLAARLAGIRALAWGIRHSNLDADKNKKSTLLMIRVCAGLSSFLPRAILSCSKRAMSVHIAEGYCANKFSVIPNGFELTRFFPDEQARDEVRVELGLDLNTLLVGMIARNHPQKNHLGFIEAATKVITVFPQVNFLLAGSGVDKTDSNLMKAISKTGAERNFHLLGRRDDIPRLMAALDVLASPSWGEAFPNVLGEAMACGVPCVVTDVGDSAEIVGDTGCIVPVGAMDELARNLLELLDKPDLRASLGLRARQRVKEEYDILDVAKRYEKFYLNLVRQE